MSDKKPEENLVLAKKKAPKYKQYVCRVCLEPGHNKATCPQKLPYKKPGTTGPARIWEGKTLEIVLDGLRSGCPLSTACWATGHNPDSLRELCERHEDVRAVVEQAKAVGQKKLIRELFETEDGKIVPARTWLLERLNPKEFRHTTKVQQEISGGQNPLEIVLVATPEELLTLASTPDDEIDS